MKEELIYWIALTQLKNWRTERINKLIEKIISEQKMLLSDFFQLSNSDLMNFYGIDDKEIIDLENVIKELPGYSFLTEDLIAQGYEIITIVSPLYSKTLKENLKLKFAPPVIYVKGNTQLLHENSIAIVGSRDADGKSLEFTDNVAKNASKNFKVVVSGFAKGVDKQALDSAIKYVGQSIIVLPQGIMTFNSGFNKYYREIQRGDVLVLSTFFPKAPWSAQLAMARNPIIYGLAKEIYVAQSSDKGGTWYGVIDGLRKGREIYVRQPDVNEKNANQLLIDKGAIPVDFFGNLIIQTKSEKIEPLCEENNNETLEDRIIKLLTGSELTSSEIIKALCSDWNTTKMTSFLKKMENVTVLKTQPLKFTISSDSKQKTLF